MRRKVYYKKNGKYRHYWLADGSGGGSTKQTSRARAEAYVEKLLSEGGPATDCTLEDSLGDLFVYATCKYVNTLGEKGWCRLGMPDAMIQLLMGHTDTRITKHYNHPDRDDLVAKVEGSRFLIQRMWNSEEESELSA